MVDKDLASGLLAHDLGAEMLLIPTGMRASRFIRHDGGTLAGDNQRRRGARLSRLEFGAGSMEPKLRLSRFRCVHARCRRRDRRAGFVRSWKAGTRIIASGQAAVALAVNGALMRGLRLNPNMVAAGAEFMRRR